MTRERAKELLPIITAFTEGKMIQVETINGWIDLEHNPSWISSKYRLKPEPREWWLCGHYYYPIKFDAEQHSIRSGCPIIHVREVI